MDNNEHIYPGTEKAIVGRVNYPGKPKSYYSGYIEGFHHVELHSFYKQGIVVRYVMTGVTYSWDWADREQGWDWFRNRNVHVDNIKALRGGY